jgi:hypothetical protein
MNKLKFYYTNGKTYNASRVTSHIVTPHSVDYIRDVVVDNIRKSEFISVPLTDLACLKVKDSKDHSDTFHRIKPSHPVCVSINKG